MLSTNHPRQTVINAINHPFDFKPLYLSFPISQPRVIEKRGDLYARNEISGFIRKAYEIQSQCPKLVVFCPLAIDEIPFLNCAPSADASLFNEADIIDPAEILVVLNSGRQETTFVKTLLAAPVLEALSGYSALNDDAAKRDVRSDFANELNRVLTDRKFYANDRFPEIAGEIKSILKKGGLTGDNDGYNATAIDFELLVRLNRLLLEATFGSAIAVSPSFYAELPKKTPTVEFDRDRLRWPLDELWPEGERLVPNPPNKSSKFFLDQLEKAAGNILTDVTWRDYRLVDQSNQLAVFNPLYERRKDMAGSVLLEVLYAQGLRVVSYLYQSENHDPDDMVGFQVNVKRGGNDATMEPVHSSYYIVRVDTEAELYDRIKDFAKGE